MQCHCMATGSITNKTHVSKHMIVMWKLCHCLKILERRFLSLWKIAPFLLFRSVCDSVSLWSHSFAVSLSWLHEHKILIFRHSQWKRPRFFFFNFVCTIHFYLVRFKITSCLCQTDKTLENFYFDSFCFEFLAMKSSNRFLFVCEHWIVCHLFCFRFPFVFMVAIWPSTRPIFRLRGARF